MKQKYDFSIQLGNNVILNQENIIEFILVNGTNFGELATSPLFTTVAKGSSSSAAITPPAYATSFFASHSVTSLAGSTSSTSGLFTGAKSVKTSTSL